MVRKAINYSANIDDQMLDNIAAEYEKESWYGGVGPTKARHHHISNKDLTTISVQLSQLLLQITDHKAKSKKENRSLFLRDPLSHAL
ncbi:hypothetical protein [Bifidobacterium polysaccharolyticum]|uniref:hypothetical protein n=1 Tax=Bifidobacterium polysaccharolyticum TaxID=2750967 RepID=UPI00061AC303|nr:hypothetical protein JF71_07540 [Bifidobacterium asteroides]